MSMQQTTPECQRLRDAASDYLDGYLGDDERSTFAVHLDGCSLCEAFVDELGMTLNLLSGLREPSAVEVDELVARRLYDEYFPEPDLPDDLADWTSIKQTWGELASLTPDGRLRAVRESDKYQDPLLFDWLAGRARKLSTTRPEAAVAAAEMALELGRQREAAFGDSRRMVLALEAVACVHVMQGNLPAASVILRELKELCEVVEVLPEDKAKCLSTMGLFDAHVGRTEKAEAHLTEALELRRGSGSRRGVLCQLVNLAATVLNAGDAHRAIEFSREAEKYLDTDRDPPRMQVALYSNLILALCEAGLTTEARELLPRARGLANRVRAWYSTTYASWLKGTLLLAEGRYRGAERIFEDVRAEFLVRGHLVWFIEASLDLARVHLEEGRLADLSALASELLMRIEKLHADERVRSAVVRFAQAVRQRSLSSQAISSIAVALSSARLNRRV